MSIRSVHGLSGDQLRQQAARARREPPRSHSIAARVLFRALDALYGSAHSLEKFRVLEVVARVPYQAWEQVAFVAITHTHEQPRFARRIQRRVEHARAQQDNELAHLLIIEELLDQRNHRRTLVRGRLLPQAMAFVYYQLSWLLFVVRPAWSYALNADFEDHATHTYLDFVDSDPGLAATPWISDFRGEYGPHVKSLAELFTSIALDERAHRHDSERLIADARFGRRSDGTRNAA
jgi:hypothetical protein